MTRFLLRQHTSTLFIKKNIFLSRNTFIIGPQVIKHVTLSSFDNFLLKQTIVRQEPEILLLTPSSTFLQVSGLRSLTPKEYSLLEENTPEGVSFRDFITIMLAKVFFHLKSLKGKENLEVILLNIFKDSSILKVPTLLIKYMPDKRLLVYLQHLVVYVLGHKTCTFNDLELFCGSDISCASFENKEIKILEFIEVMMFKHIFKCQLGNPYLRFHLINPEALIPQFSPLESKSITGQKNSDFLVERFFNKDPEKLTFYIDIKSNITSGLGSSSFSLLQGTFKGSYKREINNIIKGLTKILETNNLLSEQQIVQELLNNFKTIIDLEMYTDKEKYSKIIKDLLNLVFNPTNKFLKLRLAVDINDVDVEFDSYYKEVLKPIIDNLKNDSSSLKELFPKDSSLPSLENKINILDPYIDHLVTSEDVKKLKDNIRSRVFLEFIDN